MLQSLGEFSYFANDIYCERISLGTRSKSAARSQRSLSVARVGDATRDVHVSACVHKQHSRLESLCTLQAGGNRLHEIPLTLPDVTMSPRKKLANMKKKEGVSYSFFLFYFW